jgi:DNA-binding NarL/FixJ family response regulator
VLIAQAVHGSIELHDARVTASVRQGRLHVVANLPRPPESQLGKLTTAEREVALALVDGYSKFDIANARSTSVHTIGRQVSSLFAKLNVKGRFDLICRMGR